MSQKPELDQFYYQELYDRLHVIMSMIDNHLQQHPAAKIETDIKDLISEAQDKLWEAYQITGNKDK